MHRSGQVSRILADQLGCILIIFFYLAVFRNIAAKCQDILNSVCLNLAQDTVHLSRVEETQVRCDSAGTWQVLWISDAIWTVYWLVPPPAP